jgi:hypothetical protein
VRDKVRIRDYVRGRADVSRRPLVIGSRAWGRLAVAGVVMAVVVVGLFLNLPTPTGPAHASTPPPSGSALPASQSPDATFPAEVDGLPVISVAHAVEQLRSGKLDGQAVAVAGYYDEFTPSCPYPGRYIGPLESWCRRVAFADTRAGAHLCQSAGSNGISCHQPTGTYLAPFLMSETSGGPGSWLTGATTGEPAALVVIGHAGDPRQWQCTAATQAECTHAFVVDRIAWAEGHDVPASAPQIGDQQTGKAITPRMTLAQVAAAIGLTDDLLTGAAVRAGAVATVDPRRNFAGDNVMWLVRSLAPAAEAGANETRPETVWLLDDATGRVIDSHPLKLPADYQPARLWQMATVHGDECCAGNVLAFYRVAAADGTLVYEGIVPGGSSGGTDSTTFGGSYGSGPLVLPAGRYSISAWLATSDGGAMGAPRDECSTQVTLGPLDDIALDADYPAGRACTFQPASSPSAGS